MVTASGLTEGLVQEQIVHPPQWCVDWLVRQAAIMGAETVRKLLNERPGRTWLLLTLRDPSSNQLSASSFERKAQQTVNNKRSRPPARDLAQVASPGWVGDTFYAAPAGRADDCKQSCELCAGHAVAWPVEALAASGRLRDAVDGKHGCDLQYESNS